MFRLWRAARSEPERNKQLVRLSELCEPEIRLALKAVAKKEPSVKAWLDRRRLTFEEVANAVFPAVKDAASNYDPGHESGASFPTFAMKHIRGEVAHVAMSSPPLAGPEGPEDRPQEEPHPEEEPLDFADLIALVRKHRKSKIVEYVYEAAKYPDEYSSEDLRRLADLLEEKYAEELKRDAKLRALHSNLLVMSNRAADYEGRMVNIGTLWHLLLIREYRRARGMPEESYSPSVLARVYGKPSDKTLRRWFRECDEEGITSQNWTPEQLARIIWSRRGPRFRDRRVLPNRRPDSKPYLSQLIAKIASPEVFGRSLITWLMSRTRPTAVTVRRRYRVDQSACEDAIRRLLDYGKKKRDRRPDTDGPCDAKGNSDDGSRARTSISI